MFSNNLVCDILCFVDSNINNKISIDDIAKKFYFNRYYIMKLFKREIGISITQYIKFIRIHNSLSDIMNTNYSFTKIAFKNGFNSLEYFSETFKDVLGVSPSVYKDFCFCRYKLGYNQLDIIRDKLAIIVSLIEDVRKYKKNKKPSVPMVKKLSIF